MNYAIIFAGGTGQRMNNQSCPKQFLELYGKPVIVYTLERFQEHPLVDGIVVACLEDRIADLWELVDRYSLTKVESIVAGGETGQESIYHALHALDSKREDNPTVLIHDGVRPLVDDIAISSCIECVEQHGNAITVVPAIETIVLQEGGEVQHIVERRYAYNAKAPQCFKLNDILAAHEESRRLGKNDFIDSASLMWHFGYRLHTVEGSPANIKITTPSDFYVFRALIDERESARVFN